MTTLIRPTYRARCLDLMGKITDRLVGPLLTVADYERWAAYEARTPREAQLIALYDRLCDLTIGDVEP